MYLVMLYPLLLQVAHPTVGAGVRDYSNFAERPWDRLLRTLDYVSLLVYGGEQAVAAGQRLRALHKGFRGVREDGRPYHALEPEAYAWVHATLLETYVSGRAYFCGPLRREEIDRFYGEYRRLGRLIGVRENDLPPTWEEFRDYFQGVTRDVLVRTESVACVLEAVHNVAPPPVPVPDLLWRAARIPARRALWLGGVGLLTPSLRRRLGVGWSLADEAQFRALGRFARGITPLMPRGLRVMGPEHLRWRRRAIAHGPLGAGA
jgi:uncharacterized protein (DUF2236 family)